MEKTCAILSGGAYSSPAGIEDAELVITCDKGYAYAVRAGIKPDLFVGDFDSLTGGVAADVPVLKLPFEKDDTDTMAAVRYAVEHGYTRLRLYCALGGRLDHLLGNLQAAVFAVRHGARVEVVDDADSMLIFLQRQGDRSRARRLFAFAAVAHGCLPWRDGARRQISAGQCHADQFFPHRRQQ